MFGQNVCEWGGKSRPSIRFAGFTDEWRPITLGEIAKKVTRKNKDSEYTEVFTNSAEYGIISQRDFFDHDVANQKNVNTYYIVEPNYFIYNPRISTIAPVGPINRNKQNRTGVISPLYTVFEVDDTKVDLTFLELYFKTSLWHAYMKFNGDSGARSDRFSIKDRLFWAMPIYMPTNKKEQIMISSFLTNLFSDIETESTELTKLRNLKQACLAQMFAAA